MAEPTGIFIEFAIDEKGIKKLLNHKFEKAAYNKKLGYYFCELLYDCNDNPGNVFILNYHVKTNKCFIAYVLNHFEKSLIQALIDSLQIISSLKSPQTTEYSIVSSTFPEVLEAYKITDGNVAQTNQALPSDIVTNLMDRFWSFSENNAFPEPNIALTKRNYFYKNFKNYYKKYLGYIEEIERPHKIAKATKDNPYHLFDNFYTYDNRVFEFRNHTKQIIELPQSDPVSFRDVAGIKADKNFVYNAVLAPNSPPSTIKVGAFTKNNPDAIWQWVIMEGIDGESFNYVKEKWDTVYWKDKNAVFIYKNKELIKLEGADSSSFTYLDFCYGRDNNHIFYLDQVIPIDVNNYTLNKNGFIYDKKNVFHYENQLELDAGTFKVLTYESEVNPFMGEFILEDKNGRYSYNRKRKDELIRPISTE
ncbi:DKNYY domain-containing protein [Zobellia galactanivorans]|uniref:DKNYY domain-containing protein n=1 Tax=Zobellia galactanivorans (strain DSM 12802 / CCUG 47099 / CIP 106680 / NCIMB 13871 / Dsij) TaxID=63186 RepID=UPI001C073980|nr:DKNYY domain-containing protein [Zobellia galactanivorans]MBU3024739.1 DKNYY domain-containing protein [Zobellia galactanivorans]